MDLVFYGHHKAATSWLAGNFANLMRDAGWRGFGINNLHLTESDISRIKTTQANKKSAFYLLTNSCWSDRDLFPESKGIHLIRDPRDMIVSAYYSHRDTHPLFPGLAEERGKLQNASFEDGLIIVIEGIMNDILKELGKWQFGQDDSIFEARFEDVKKDGGKVMRDFLEFAGVSNHRDQFYWPRAAFNVAVKKTGLAPNAYWYVPYLSEKSLQTHLSRRDYKKSQRGSKKGHHRSGALNQWEDAFTEKIKDKFKSSFPNLVTQMGYNEDENW